MELPWGHIKVSAWCAAWIQCLSNEREESDEGEECLGGHDRGTEVLSRQGKLIVIAEGIRESTNDMASKVIGWQCRSNGGLLGGRDVVLYVSFGVRKHRCFQ